MTDSTAAKNASLSARSSDRVLRDIVNAVCEYLAARRHFFYRSNNIPVFDKAQQTFRRLPKYTPRGVSDIVLVHVGRPYFIEVKRRGTYQSPEQKVFQQRAERAGALYAVVLSIDDVQALGL